MHKVLVVSTNREEYPCPVLPVGAIQLTKQFINKGIDSYFLDLCFMDDYIKVFNQELQLIKPSIVIFSIRNIDNETYVNTKFYLTEVKGLIKECKQSNIVTVIGGSGVIVNYYGVFRYLKPDYGVCESNLTSTKMLVSKLLKNENIDKVPNIIYWAKGNININLAKSKNIELTMFEWDYIMKNSSSKYLRNIDRGPASIGIQTKKGCRFNCIHCQISKIEGTKIKSYPYEYIIDSLKILEKNGVTNCFITDNVFNEPYEHAYEICKRIIEAGIHIKWSCYLVPKRIDSKLIRIMKEAGCVNVQFGVDTASDQLLRIWHKGFTSLDIITAGKVCEKEKLFCSYSLIIGGWGETPETIIESLNILKEARAKFIWGALGVRVQKGTDLYDKLFKEKVITDNEDDLVYPYFYLSPQIKDSYKEVINTFKMNNPNIILKINEG